MVAFLIGCGGNDEPVQITVMTHDSFAISEAILTEFEEANNVEIVILPSGDAGAVLNQAILTEDNPLADLLYGVDNTFLSRALDADIFEAYESDALTAVPDTLELDSSHRLTPVDFGDVCLNYDKNWFEEKGIEPPQTLAELTEPAYESLTVVENPSTSSPGLAFLLATIGVFGTDGEYTYQDYWADLRANDVLVTDGWESAYYGQFSGAGDGSRPIVVSYASSPPAEVVFADPPIDEPPTAAVTTPDTCFRQIEFVGILKGTKHREQAEAFIDFMLSQTFQEDIPLNMFVFPANSEAALPEVFIQWTAVPESPVLVDSAEIEANRASWIETWTNVVLR
jgi:thiamine transport system substrate-binding protein